MAVGLAIVDTEAYVVAHSGTARLTDRIHSNAELYAEIARNRAQQLAPLVEARMCKPEQA